MVEIDCRKLGLVEEGGYELARAGNVIAVVCKRVRKKEMKMPKNALPLHSSSRTHNSLHKANNNSCNVARSGGGGPNQTGNKKPKSKSNKSA